MVKVVFHTKAPSETEDAYGNRRMVDGPDIEAMAKAAPYTESETEDGRPHGAQQSVKLYFRLPVFVDFRGATAEVYGRTYKVQGAPSPWPPEGAFKGWGYEIEAVRHDG